jgi:hypothetical protein
VRRLALALLIALSLTGPAGAQSKTQATALPAPPQAKSEAGKAADPRDAAAKPAASGLRGSSPVLASGKIVTGVPEAPGIRRRAADTALMSPNLATPAAPRLTRDLDPGGGGGGQCRTKCAQELYFCEANEGGCDETWRKCVLSCPSQSGSTP